MTIALLLATVALIEAALQGLVRLPTCLRLIRTLTSVTLFDASDPDFIWKKRFLDKYELHWWREQFTRG